MRLVLLYKLFNIFEGWVACLELFFFFSFFFKLLGKLLMVSLQLAFV